MPKKARKCKEPVRKEDRRPPPTKTPHEIMLLLDAENMVRLLHELISFMPGTFRSMLQTRGFLQFKVADYDVLIADNKRFEKNNTTYGRVAR